MDRSDYYGGESTSLNLNQVLLFKSLLMVLWQFTFIHRFYFCVQLWKKFRGEEKAPEHLGASRDYNVDMMPKVLLLVAFIILYALKMKH